MRNKAREIIAYNSICTSWLPLNLSMSLYLQLRDDYAPKPRPKVVLSRKSPLAANPLCEAHIADIDRDHQHFENRPAIGPARVGATLGWQTNAKNHEASPA
jgi:hypothetical protein